LAQTVNQSNLCSPLITSDDMGRSINEWIIGNGINIDQVISLGATPNRLMPEVFREIDLAVFPNRCEAGTNLVAMEALAYGITCLISRNTGHLDLIKDQNCIPLLDQKSINAQDKDGWGESSVEEMVAFMEECYQGKKKIDPSIARESMLNHSWEKAINSMLTKF